MKEGTEIRKWERLWGALIHLSIHSASIGRALTYLPQGLAGPKGSRGKAVWIQPERRSAQCNMGRTQQKSKSSLMHTVMERKGTLKLQVGHMT